MPQVSSVYEVADAISRITRRPESAAEASCVPMPLSTAEVFDHAFDILKSNFVPLLLLVAVVFLPLHLIEQYIVSSWLNPRFTDLGLQNSPDSAFQSFGQLFTLSLEYIPTGYPRFGIPGAMLFLAALFTSAPVSAAVTDIIAGRPISIVDNYRAAWAVRWQLVCGSLLAGMCCFAIWAGTTALIGAMGFFPVLFLTAMAADLPDPSVAGWVVLIYILICMVLPFAVTCLFYGRTFAFLIPVCVNERTSTMGGVARSQQLARQVPYRTTLLTFTMLPLVVIALQFMLFFGCNTGLQFLQFSPQWNYMASTALCALFVCLLHTYWMVYIARLYYDYRVKRECLDIRMLMAGELRKDAGN